MKTPQLKPLQDVYISSLHHEMHGRVVTLTHHPYRAFKNKYFFNFKNKILNLEKYFTSFKVNSHNPAGATIIAILCLLWYDTAYYIGVLSMRSANSNPPYCYASRHSDYLTL